MKKSVARQLAVMFISLLVLVMVAMLFANNVFLERFYEIRLRSILIRAYTLVDAHIGEDGIDEDYFLGEFSELERSGNIRLVVLNLNYEPVIGNGDVNSAERAGAMMAETGCDYVMIGRASQGNPWIFREAAAYLAALKGGKSAEEAAAAVPPRPMIPEIHAMMLRHAEALLKEKGETLGVLEMRKHIAWYTTGLPGSAALRAGINAAADYPALKALLDQWLSESCKHELS